MRKTPEPGYRDPYAGDVDATPVVVITATDDHSVAEAIARGSVDLRLAACAQVTGPMTSVYRWHGAVESAQEWRVECKTTMARVPSLTEYIVEQHAYDLPEVIVLPIAGGSAAYLDWISTETSRA